MDTYKKLKIALLLEKEFENENLEETWIGVTKSDNGQLIARVAQVEEKRVKEEEIRKGGGENVV